MNGSSFWKCFPSIRATVSDIIQFDAVKCINYFVKTDDHDDNFFACTEEKCVYEGIIVYFNINTRNSYGRLGTHTLRLLGGCPLM